MEKLTKLTEVVSQNWGRFAALILLMALAFVIAGIAERIASQRDIKEGKEPEKLLTTRKMAVIGVFSAIAFVLMLIEFPLPIAPGFYKFDFSDVAALIVGFAFGPFAGVMVEFIKVVLNVLIQGTSSAFVGEIANFVIGASYVSTASIIYRFNRTRKGALIGSLVATLFIAFIGAALNAYFMIPAYALMFGGEDVIINAGTAIYPFVNNIFTFCLFCVAPFNLIKGILHSIATFAIYKQISPILKTGNVAPRRKNRAVVEQ